MPLEHFKNTSTPSTPSMPFSTLTASMDASVTTLAVASKAKFPAVPFRLVVGDEYMLATADAGALSYTVTRGIEGSTAATHASAANVFHILTAGGLANSPGPLTTTGDTLRLSSTGAVERVPIGATRTAFMSDGSVGDWRAIQAADLPSLPYLPSAAINLATSGAGGVIGNLPVGNLAGGSGASGSTFWRGDGTWAAPSAGSVAWGAITGTLADQTDLASALAGKLSASLPGADTQILFNDGGSLGASANLTWNEATSKLLLTNDAGSLPTFKGRFNIYETGLTFSGAAFALDMRAVVNDAANATAYAHSIDLSLPAGVSHNIGSLIGQSSAIAVGIPTGLSVVGVSGNSAAVENSGAGTVDSMRGSYAQVDNYGGGVITDADVFQGWIYSYTNGSTYGRAAILSGYFDFSATGTIPTAYGAWFADMAGPAVTNAYYFWADSRGVYRIREDNVADGSGNPQAIPALYNPRFTKYTPGATNFERSVEQWVGNVLQIGAEAGGTGTVRPVQLIGASVSAVGNLTAANLSGTNTGDQDLSGLVPNTRTVNGHALSVNVSVTASDVGLGSVENAAASGLYVPLTRTVNGSALSSNVTISTITGNAGTATALQTARAINGVSFDGTAAITVPAAAGTLTGATLASGVTASSLTSFGSTPTLVTPVLGVATATSINKLTITAPATSATLTIADGKTFTVNQTLTLTGTTGTTMTFPATSATIARTDAAQNFTGIQTGLSAWETSAVTISAITSGGYALGVNLKSTAQIAFTNGNPWDTHDVIAVRDGAGIWAQKDGANAQTIRIYGTTTGSKYLSLKHDGTNPIIGSSSGGLKADSTAITPATTGTRYLIIDTAGNITSSATAPSGT